MINNHGKAEDYVLLEILTFVIHIACLLLNWGCISYLTCPRLSAPAHGMLSEKNT